jgi:hypothetical protein
VDRDNIEQSPLLRKALERHGGSAKPPLGGRDSAAYQSLEAWAKKLSKRAASPEAGSPAEDQANSGAFESPAANQATPAGSSGFAAERSDSPAKPMRKADAPDAQPAGKKEASPTKERPPANDKEISNSSSAAAPKLPTGDPFDPNVFNRQFHKQ